MLSTADRPGPSGSPAAYALDRRAQPPLRIVPARTRRATVISGAATVVSGVLDRAPEDGARWRATLRRLDRPGALTRAYFVDGVRDVVVQLDDGRRLNARIAGSSYTADNERVCYLVGGEEPAPA